MNRDVRESLGWTQEQAATFFGVGQSTIANWETGTSEPPKLAKVIMSRLEHVAGNKTPKAVGEKLLHAVEAHGHEGAIEVLFGDWRR